MATQGTNLESGPQQTFPFMRLPAELRLVIYELTMDDMIEYTEFSNQSSSMVGSQMRARGMLALLLTSKIIRAESSKVLRPLWTIYLDGFLEAVKLLRRDRDVKQNDFLFHSNALLQIDRQLDQMYVGRRAKVAVRLALQRAAGGSQLQYNDQTTRKVVGQGQIA